MNKAQYSENEVFTIGHSTHSFDRFLSLLQQQKIAIVADVRSTPYSRYQQHFNKETLRVLLREHSIDYVPLGEELGGRIGDCSCYIDGQIQYPLVAKTDNFKQGLDRLIEGIRKFRVAIMCSEQDPTECHRFLLVSRALLESGIQVSHILGDGQVTSHDIVLDRLRTKLKTDQLDLFSATPDAPSHTIERTYAEQASRVAFVDTRDGSTETEI